MFDIGFSEILVIAVVALVVVGPERLPKVARTLGHMFGRLQRYVNEVKSDINREMELDELRKLQGEVQDAARGIEQSVTQVTSEVDAAMRETANSVDQALAPPVELPATPVLQAPSAAAAVPAAASPKRKPPAAKRAVPVDKTAKTSARVRKKKV
jgi:sec-independent protein translocase protein TatB